MSTRYSPDYKSLVARLLWIYGGNVALVSHLTGIPQRTLRDWRWEAAFPAESRREDPSERRESPVLPPEKIVRRRRMTWKPCATSWYTTHLPS